MDERAKQLHNIARGYVHSLGKGDFDAIPYDNDVELRAPFCPGGCSVPLLGRSNLKEVWWAPMPSLVAGTKVIDTYVNQNLSAVMAEFLCRIKEPPCILRIVDRFKINAEGRITSQENFFDPRDVTHPGWRDA